MYPQRDIIHFHQADPPRECQDLGGESVVECGVWTPINGGVGGAWRLTGSTANAIESQHNHHHAWPGPTESLPDGTDCGVPPIFDDSFIISCAVRATSHPSAASERAEQRREPAWGHAGSQIAGHIAEAPRGACAKCMGFDPRQPRRVLDPSSHVNLYNVGRHFNIYNVASFCLPTLS